MILHTQSLVDALRERCNQAQKRIWIASPFIGNVKGVNRVIGSTWMRSSIDFKILTDVEKGFIKKDTFDNFREYNTEIRSLISLHAKIYLIDDWCLITSANLTGTAFSRRYEVGTLVDEADIKDIEDLYMKWWNMAKRVISVSNNKINHTMSNYQDGDGTSFKQKCKLPPYAEEKYDKYLAKCELYGDFATLYKKYTGRNKNMIEDGFTLYQEMDCFFNYLYHYHHSKPSNKCNQKRELTDDQRIKEIQKYFKEFVYNKKKELFRIDRSVTISHILSQTNINTINWDNIKQVVMCFHCYSSYPLNRTRFLNPNNSLKIIIKYWDYLLHTGDITSTKIKEVTINLHYFGTSAIQELIGWYYPEKYPLMNSNSDCGMRFFGYDDI